MSFATVLQYFREITTIPRPSGHEEAMRKRLTERADSHKFSYRTDAVGNVVIYVPATSGNEHSPTIILQAHMDMVCVQAQNSTHNFFTDPLVLQENEGRLSAADTTLGADNGIGIAIILAVANTAAHPALELFFTIDEERGLVGALEFDPALLSGTYLINLDTEDEGDICISCAGGARLTATTPTVATATTLPAYEIVFTGFPGGHSGVDIDKKRGNALLAMMECLTTSPAIEALCSLSGGQADNAIPGSCRAVITTANSNLVEQHIQDYLLTYKKTSIVPDATYSLQKTEYHANGIEHRKERCTNILSLPQGVQGMSTQIPDLVQTSLNLGICTMDTTHISATYSLRSSVFEELLHLSEFVQREFVSRGYTADIYSVYPGRQDSPNGILVQKTKEIYERSTQKPVHVVAYHAGLECGAIVAKLPQRPQAVSLGPTIVGAHSPQERVYLPSVEIVYQIVCVVINVL